MIGGVLLSRLTGPRRVELLRRCNRSTAKKCLTDFKGALAEAKGRGLIAGNPAANIKIVDSQRKARRPVIPMCVEIRVIEQTGEKLYDEAATKACRNEDGVAAQFWMRFYPIFLVLRWTGMQPKECRALRDQDIIWDGKQIRVELAAGEKGVIGPPETAAGRRTIDVPDDLLTAIKSWIEVRGESRSLLFPTELGRPINHASLTNRLWYPLSREAGIKAAAEEEGSKNGGFSLHVL